MTNEEFKKIVKEKFNNLTYDGEFESIRKTPRLIFHCNKEDHNIPFSIEREMIQKKVIDFIGSPTTIEILRVK